MRTIALAVMGVVLVAAVICPAFAADQSVNVYIDGKLQSFEPGAIVRNGKAYVPLRQSGAALGATVNYDATNRVIKMVYCGKTTHLKQSEGITVNGSMFVPLRRVSTAFGCKVAYDATATAVRITRPAAASGGG